MSRGGRRESAVLVSVFRDSGGRVQLVVVRRVEGGVHGGQLAFPSGMREPGETELETALREAEEEIGLPRTAVRILSVLPAIETRTTGFRIVPWLGRIERPAGWLPARAEVAAVIEVALDEPTEPGTRGEAKERFPTWPEPQRIEFYRLSPHRLWGASSRILDPLLPRLVAGQWEIYLNAT